MTDVTHAGAATAAPLTADQQKALANLHSAATEFEGVFMQMVMDAMRQTVPDDSLFGHGSASEQTWQSMLDNEYAQGLAKSGGVGLAAQMERQMRDAVLANAKSEAQTNVDPRRIEP